MSPEFECAAAYRVSVGSERRVDIGMEGMKHIERMLKSVMEQRLKRR